MDLRVMDTGPGAAEANMQRDREIIEAVSARPSEAVLRWFGWDPPAYSLGYGQKAEALLDTACLEATGTPWAKRTTGGSLVFHDRDLSYSFTIPRENPWGIVTTDELYRFVSGAWVEGLGRIGIAVTVPREVPPSREVPEAIRNLCLAFHSPGDLLLKGRKVAGSSQRRLRAVWQQQGFFLLRPLRPPPCLRDPHMVNSMVAGSIDLESAGYPVDRDTLRETLTRVLKERWEHGQHRQQQQQQQ